MLCFLHPLAAALFVARRIPSWRLVVVLSLVASFRYMLTEEPRRCMELTGDIAVSLLLYAAELYALVTLVGGYFQTAITRRNTPPPIAYRHRIAHSRCVYTDVQRRVGRAGPHSFGCHGHRLSPQKGRR